MHPPLTTPCLRGTFGDWVYYSTLLPMREISKRVNYAKEIHSSKALSDMIQRSLEGERASKIAEYLRNNPERFFNSLVLATYEGDPEWFDVGNLRSSRNEQVLKEVPDGSLDTLGLLRLSGAEKIFALDGQHRLAGIRQALSESDTIGSDLVPVILVGHATDADGSRRTRRLFTTLNKTAVAVKKRDIIALDEDDVMAITARRMVEQDPGFMHPKVAVISSESMPSSNQDSLLTIAALYDLLKSIFKQRDGLASDHELRFNRPNDVDLDAYHDDALAFFNAVGKTFKPIAEFLGANKTKDIVAKYRTAAGGHLLFRTVGFDILTQTAIAIAKRDEITIAEAIPKLAKLPTRLSRPPYADTIWDTSKRVIKPANKILARKLVFYMLRLPLTERQRRTLLGDYRLALGYDRTDTTIQLPPRFD